MKTLFSAIFLIAFFSFSPAQNFDNWTIWTQSGIIEIDSACSVSPECDDQNPASRDYCNGIWCTHTYSAKHTVDRAIDMDVDPQGNVWVTARGQNTDSEHPQMAKFNGTDWEVYNRHNSGLGRPNPEPYPVPINPFQIWSSAISPSGKVHSISRDHGLYSFDGQSWERNDLQNSGISSTDLRIIEVAPDGSIWLAGDAPVELAVWDSVSWTIYSPLNSGLPDERIWAIDFSDNGSVWLGTDGAGIIEFDGTNWTQYTQASHGLPNDVAGEIMVVGNEVWACMRFGELSYFDGSSWQDGKFGESFVVTSAITIDQNNHIWTGTVDGIAKYDGLSWTFFTASALGMTSKFVDKITADSSGLVWFYSLEGTLRPRIGHFDGTSYFEFYPFVEGVKKITETSTGDILFSDVNGMWRYDKNDGSIVIDSTAYINGGYDPFAVDLAGNWWIRGNSLNSVRRFDGSTFTEWNYLNSNLPNRFIRQIYLALDGTIWVVPENSGVAYFDGVDWINFNHLNSNISDRNIQGISQGSDGTMVFVDYSGTINFFDGQTFTHVDPSTSIGLSWSEHFFAIEDTNDFWIAAPGAGVYHYQNGTVTSYGENNSGLPDEDVNGIIRLPSGEVWIASPTLSAGIATFDGANWGTINRQISPLPNDGIRSIHLDIDNNIWLTGKAFIARIGQQSTSPFFPINGIAFHDLNANGVQDNNEAGLAYQKIKIDPLGIYLFTNPSGEFNTMVPAGSYVSDWISSPYYASTNGTTSYSFSLDSLNPASPNLYYALAPSGMGADMVSSINTGITRCNWAGRINLKVQNLGDAVATTPEVKFVLDPKLSFDFADPTPSNISGDTLYWNLGDLFPQEQQKFRVFVTPINASIGDTFRQYVDVTTANDINLANNRAEDVSPLRCSFDPNDKKAMPLGIGEEEEILLGEPLIYTIRFQNTGNDTAFLVAILDTIDVDFSFESFEFLQASHDLEIISLPNRTIKFLFENIYLPDSATDVLGSQGFVQYRIFPKTNLLARTKVQNSAAIYFDANAPIITNTVNRTYVDFFTGLEEKADFHFSINPNPAQDVFSVELDHRIKLPASLKVVDVNGRALLQREITDSNLLLSCASFPPGMYFVTINSNQAQTQKLIVR